MTLCSNWLIIRLVAPVYFFADSSILFLFGKGASRTLVDHHLSLIAAALIMTEVESRCGIHLLPIHDKTVSTPIEFTINDSGNHGKDIMIVK